MCYPSNTVTSATSLGTRGLSAGKLIKGFSTSWVPPESWNEGRLNDNVGEGSKVIHAHWHAAYAGSEEEHHPFAIPDLRGVRSNRACQSSWESQSRFYRVVENTSNLRKTSALSEFAKAFDKLEEKIRMAMYQREGQQS